MNEKVRIGERAAEFVQDGMIVGLGTGSTVYFTIKKLGKLVREGLSIQGVPTSIETEVLAEKVGIPLIGFQDIDRIDVAIDGADEVDPDLILIKGGGGALLREKIVAKAAKKFIVVADSSKIVEKLGHFPLPVEVLPFGHEMTSRHLKDIGCTTEWRRKGKAPFVTNNGNYIYDCRFPEDADYVQLERDLNLIPGVVENGLFVGMADTVVTMDEEKLVLLKKNSSSSHF